jgi:hypothetical protein
VKNKDRGRRKRQGQKGHFTAVLSPPELEMNILMCLVFSNKFGNDKSVYQQIALFSVSAGKKGGHFQCPKANFAFIYTRVVNPNHIPDIESGVLQKVKNILVT